MNLSLRACVGKSWQMVSAGPTPEFKMLLPLFPSFSLVLAKTPVVLISPLQVGKLRLSVVTGSFNILQPVSTCKDQSPPHAPYCSSLKLEPGNKMLEDQGQTFGIRK